MYMLNADYVNYRENRTSAWKQSQSKSNLLDSIPHCYGGEIIHSLVCETIRFLPSSMCLLRLAQTGLICWLLVPHAHIGIAIVGRHDVVGVQELCRLRTLRGLSRFVYRWPTHLGKILFTQFLQTNLLFSWSGDGLNQESCQKWQTLSQSLRQHSASLSYDLQCPAVILLRGEAALKSRMVQEWRVETMLWGNLRADLFCYIVVVKLSPQIFIRTTK